MARDTTYGSDDREQRGGGKRGGPEELTMRIDVPPPTAARITRLRHQFRKKEAETGLFLARLLGTVIPPATRGGRRVVGSPRSRDSGLRKGRGIWGRRTEPLAFLKVICRRRGPTKKAA